MGSFGKFVFRLLQPGREGDKSHETLRRNGPMPSGECYFQHEVLFVFIRGQLILVEGGKWVRLL